MWKTDYVECLWALGREEASPYLKTKQNKTENYTPQPNQLSFTNPSPP